MSDPLSASEASSQAAADDAAAAERFRGRDALSLAMIGSFFTVIGSLVLLGQFFGESSYAARVTNFAASAAILIVAAGMLAMAWRINRLRQSAARDESARER